MQRSFEDVLYDRLTTDKYGRWKDIFGEDLLRKICERMASEADDYYIEGPAILILNLEKSCIGEYSQDISVGLRP